MSDNDDLNDLLKSFEKRKQPNVKILDEQNSQEIQDINSKSGVPSANLKNTNMIDKFRANTLRSSKELEAAKIVFDTHIETLTHQSDAKVRESKAFWDAKSVEVAEKIKTYVKSSLRDLEIEQLSSRDNAITEAYERSNAKMQEVMGKGLPDSLKANLVNQLMENLEETVDRIKNDLIAEKYNLK